MKDRDYNFWLDYHNGEIKRELTEKEYSKIEAMDFAMHLFVQTEQLIKICGGYDALVKINLETDYLRPLFVKALSSMFEVPPEVVSVKINWIVQNYKPTNNKNIDVQSRILKKENNVIYVDFKNKL